MRSLSNQLVIEPNSRRYSLRELWLYRELFYFFAWRDIKVRYKQTAIGAGWAVLQPFLATGVFTLFFNRVAKISSGLADIPYPVFAYLGLMYWNLFSTSLNTMSNSLVSNQGVVTKIYFPRIILPLAATALSIVDFFFAGVCFILILAGFRIVPGLAGLLMILPSLALIVIGALSLGIFFAALNVKYRDVRSALPFITQLMLFVTPIIYPVTLVPEKFRIFLYLNPATGAITTVREGFFHQPIYWTGFAISAASAILILIFSLRYFKNAEKNFADVI